MLDFLIYDALGDREHAVEVIEQAYQARDGMLVYVNASPLYRKVRSDPRVSALIRRIGLPTL